MIKTREQVLPLADLDRLWACNLMVVRANQAISATTIIKEDDEASALGRALLTARERFPVEQGYCSHSVVVQNVGQAVRQWWTPREETTCPGS